MHSETKILTWIPMSTVAARHFQKKSCHIQFGGKNLAGTEEKNGGKCLATFWWELELKKNPNSKTLNFTKK